MKTYKRRLAYIFYTLIFLSLLSPKAAFSQVDQVIKVGVGKGGSVWTATRKIAKSLPMKTKEYNKTWNESYVEINGKNVHISKVDFVYPETIILWTQVKGLFEIKGKKIGTRRDMMIAIKKARKGRSIVTRKKKRTRIVHKKIKNEVIPLSQKEKVVILHSTLGENPVRTLSSLGQITKKPKNPQVEEMLNELPVAAITPKPSIKDKVKSTEEVVIDDTKTGNGKKFYKHFVSQWVRDKNNSSSISIVEKASILDGVHVFITVDGTIIYKTFIEPETHIIEALAKEGARATKTYVNNREQGL